MGTPAMTTRGLQPSDFERVGDVVHRAINIAKRVDKQAREAKDKEGRKNPGSVAAFKEYVGEGENITELIELRQEVSSWVSTFGLPWEK